MRRWTCSGVGDDFDFHGRAFGQGGDLHGGTGGEIRREIFGVNFVHGGEIAEVGHEDGAFDDVGEREALVVEDGFDVLQRAFGLGFDVAGGEVAGGRVERYLAGAKQQAADALKYTATDVQRLGCVDDVLPEPAGGTHNDPAAAMEMVDERLRYHLAVLRGLPLEKLLEQRYLKFRNIAQFYTTA